jgi:hypothetical protein
MPSIESLSPRERRVLAGTCRQCAGTQLSTRWYEYQRSSNFDRRNREVLREAAESAGFVEYRFGHPWVTEAGRKWALAQR